MTGSEEEMTVPEPAQGYLVDVETGEQFIFGYNPAGLQDEKSVSYAVVKLAGRSNPYVQWSSSDERKLSFTLELYRQRENHEVAQKVRWLESIQYPEYDAEGYLLSAPHRVLFIFGERYTGSTMWVVQSVKTTFHGLWTPDLLPLYASVDLTLLEWREKPMNYRDVRG